MATPPLANASATPKDGETYVLKYGMVVKADAAEKQAVDPEAEKVCSLSLRNMSKKEEARRRRLGNVGLALTLVGAAFFLAMRDRVPRHYRMVMGGPVGLWLAFWGSAETGICMISATGEWDPDGAGIRKVPDAALAARIWAKARKLLAFQIAAPLLVTAAFVNSPI